MRRNKTTLKHEEKVVTTRTMTKTEPPQWLLAFWEEIDDKAFGKGFDCLTEDATCNLGIADWHGRLHRYRLYRLHDWSAFVIRGHRKRAANTFSELCTMLSNSGTLGT